MPTHHWTLPHIPRSTCLQFENGIYPVTAIPTVLRAANLFISSQPATLSEAQLLTFQEWGCRMEVIVSIMRLHQELILGEDGY